MYKQAQERIKKQIQRREDRNQVVMERTDAWAQN